MSPAISTPAPSPARLRRNGSKPQARPRRLAYWLRQLRQVYGHVGMLGVLR